MEASRRIELLYTDLQSIAFSNEIKAQASKKYQDKAGTWREPDTRAKSDLTHENPGALAGATGAEDDKQAVSFVHISTAANPILARHWGLLV